jgi:Fic family protein
MRESLARNAYGTASIEGNPLTLEEVSSLLAKGWTPDNVVEPDEREVLRYARIVADIDAHPIQRHVAEIDRLHAHYFDGVLDEPGHLKTKPNFIGERSTRTAVYIPTPPEDTKKEMQALLDWVHDAVEHPLVKASVFFHEFQSIHPYLDGNGRLGRLLVTILLAIGPVRRAERRWSIEMTSASTGARWPSTPFTSVVRRAGRPGSAPGPCAAGSRTARAPSGRRPRGR